MGQVVVGVADCRVAIGAGQTLVTYALGSCIGLAVHDPAAAVGGILHFMLPDSSIDSARGRQKPYMFVDTGVPLLLKQMLANGAVKRRLVLLAAGGASMLEAGAGLEIGERNYQALRRVLWKEGLMLHGEAIGGVQSRTIRLEIGPGKLWVQESGERRELSPVSCRKESNGIPHIDRR